MSRTFTRQQFYELVWSKPVTHLAKEFLLSDVALHKICRKHGIPTPPAGWWAKKLAGKAVTVTPLPQRKAGEGDHITISGGENRQESAPIAAARETARVLASAITAAEEAPIHPIVERTVAKLRKAKPSDDKGLVSINGPGLINVSIAPASVDRLELALNRIAHAAGAIGIQLVRGAEAAVFQADGEQINFSVTEAVRREKHVLTEQELKKQEAAQKSNARRWNRNPWDDAADYPLTFLQFPEWDYHPTGQLSFELENRYFLSDQPRRAFNDAKVQRLESIAGDIAVGIAVFGAAKKQDEIRRAEEARQREFERQRRVSALRAEYVEDRRRAGLKTVLDELATLDRLRRLIAGLRSEAGEGAEGRVVTFLAFAEDQLRRAEERMSVAGLNRWFERKRLFGDDDDEGFRVPYSY